MSRDRRFCGLTRFLSRETDRVVLDAMLNSSTTAQRVGIASQFRRDEFKGHLSMPPRILSTETYIVLPRVTDHREIHHLYSPAHRKIDFPTADRSFLIHVARNCAAAFESIHAAGHVVGDVNQGAFSFRVKGRSNSSTVILFR